MNVENNKKSKTLVTDAKVKNQQQAKKDKLALALRENLRRRKAAIPPDKTDGEA